MGNPIFNDMPYWDYYDMMMDEEDYQDYHKSTGLPKCKGCNKEMMWKKVNGKWRLHTLEKQKLHLCKKYIDKVVRGKI